MANGLRVPKRKLPALEDARDDVASTMPRNYGDLNCKLGRAPFSLTISDLALAFPRYPLQRGLERDDAKGWPCRLKKRGQDLSTAALAI
jgi:hypothetical protein